MKNKLRTSSMNSDTEENLSKAVLDSNILVSAIIYEGKPGTVLKLTLEKRFITITSRILLSELFEVLVKKFNFPDEKIKQIDKKLNKLFRLVSPKKRLAIVKDEADNRVLEAAVEGKCKYIVTGDKELLELIVYRDIKLVTADQFLKILEEN